MNTHIINEFEGTAEDLIQTISSYSMEQFNVVPAAGGWTAGQVTEHTYKSMLSILSVINTATKQATGVPDEKVKVLKAIALDFDKKYVASERVQPTNATHDRDELLRQLAEVIAEVRKVFSQSDLSLINAEAEFPMLGAMTQLEWAYFMIYHTQRHTHQLQTIACAIQPV